jgi:hypothetical protein
MVFWGSSSITMALLTELSGSPIPLKTARNLSTVTSLTGSLAASTGPRPDRLWSLTAEGMKTHPAGSSAIAPALCPPANAC